MNRHGFTLPLALVILVAVSMMVGTAVHVSLSDFHSNRGGRLAARALFAAEAGSQHTIARWESGPYGSLSPGDSASSGWTSLPDGSRYRSVVARLDDGSGDSPLYRVTTEGRPSRTSTARRRVTTVLTGGASSPLCCDAAITVAGRLRVDAEPGEDDEDEEDRPGGGRPPWAGGGPPPWAGGGGPAGGGGERPNIDGRDHVPFAWAGYCPSLQDPVAAVQVSRTQDVQIQRDALLVGDPEILTNSSVDQSLVQTIGTTTYAALAAGADIVFEARDDEIEDVRPRSRGGRCDTDDPRNWGAPRNPGSVCWDYLPVIHARGDLTIDDDGHGQGILLVDGDLEVDDEFHFYGLVVVRGIVRWRDEARLTGGLLVGNRGNLGIRSQIEDETAIDYSSCAVARAAGRFGGTADGVRPLPGRHWFEVP